uniref:Transmembrane protein n=1 Tax=Knipowitschia caucasica TaxID=637954 RepID=A0AAV2LCG9_KNICA
MPTIDLYFNLYASSSLLASPRFSSALSVSLRLFPPPLASLRLFPPLFGYFRLPSLLFGSFRLHSLLFGSFRLPSSLFGSLRRVAPVHSPDLLSSLRLVLSELLFSVTRRRCSLTRSLTCRSE